jgi:hypothetical protein
MRDQKLEYGWQDQRHIYYFLNKLKEFCIIDLWSLYSEVSNVQRLKSTQ